jgi:hypothetical protein
LAAADHPSLSLISAEDRDGSEKINSRSTHSHHVAARAAARSPRSFALLSRPTEDARAQCKGQLAHGLAIVAARWRTLDLRRTNAEAGPGVRKRDIGYGPTYCLLSA